MLIKLLTKNELQSYRNLINTKINNNHIYSKNPSFFNWLYKNNQKFYNVAIAINSKSKVIGFQNFIPVSQFDNNIKEKHIFLALWFVDDKAEPGTGLRLFKFIETKFKNYSLSTSGFDPKMKNFHIWQKFELGVLQHYYIANPYIKNFTICKINKKKSLHFKINNFKKVKYLEINIKNINRINSKIFNLSNPKKSITYLINRYLKHPIYKYKIIYSAYKNENSIIIYRKNVFNNAYCIRIVDYIGLNKNIFLFKNYLIKLFKNMRCEYIDIYNIGLDKKTLIKMGFKLKKNKKEIIPDFFDPFLKKNIKLLYGLKNKKKNFLLFKADGDRDRPNRNYL